MTTISPCSGIRITATPSIAEPAVAAPKVIGAVAYTPDANTYKHDSYVFYKGERFLFTLNVPLINAPDTTGKAALDHEINVFKQTFLNHLAEQNNSKIQPGKDFSVAFDPTVGYTACPGPTLIQNSSDALTVNTPEALQLSKAISSGKTEDIKQALLDKKLTKYRPALPPERASAATSKPITPPASSTISTPEPKKREEEGSDTASIADSERSRLTTENLHRHNSPSSDDTASINSVDNVLPHAVPEPTGRPCR